MILERRADDRLEGAEMRVMEQPSALEAVDDREDLAIVLAGGPDDELRGRARGGQRAGHAAPRCQQSTRVLELRQKVAGEGLVVRQAMNVAVARRLEVDRKSIGQPRGFLDLR